MENKEDENEEENKRRRLGRGVVQMQAQFVKEFYWKDCCCGRVGWASCRQISPNHTRDLVYEVFGLYNSVYR